MPSPPRLTPVVDGDASGSTLFFIQGWPDDHSLWDELVRLTVIVDDWLSETDGIPRET